MANGVRDDLADVIWRQSVQHTSTIPLLCATLLRTNEGVVLGNLAAWWRGHKLFRSLIIMNRLDFIPGVTAFLKFGRILFSVCVYVQTPSSSPSVSPLHADGVLHDITERVAQS